MIFWSITLVVYIRKSKNLYYIVCFTYVYPNDDVGITKDMLVMMMKPQDFKDVIDLNLNGVFYASQAAFMGSMMGQKRGRIINVASIVGE